MDLMMSWEKSLTSIILTIKLNYIGVYASEEHIEFMYPLKFSITH